jgi:sigma-B regulation protein RsbU (phosphoserine phosphatase)
MEDSNIHKKKSVLKQIMSLFAVTILLVFIVTAAGGYYYSNTIIQRRSRAYALSVAKLVEQFFYDIDIRYLSDNKESTIYKEANKSLRKICRNFGLEYLYIIVKNDEKNCYEYILAVANEDDKNDIINKSIKEYPYIKEVKNDDSFHNVILSLNKTYQGEVSQKSININNEYGNVYTWFYPVLNENKTVKFAVGVEYTVDLVKTFIKNNAIILFIPVVIVSLILFFIQMSILQRKVFNPIKKISERMNKFVENRGKEIEPLKINSHDEIREISDSFYKMSDEIVEYIKDIKQLTKEKVEADVQIEVARGIQYGIVPHNFNVTKEHYDAYACTYSCKYIGGDFYDCFSLENGNLCLVIGDVSGKGVSAALFMAMAKTVIRELLKVGKTPAQALNLANDELCESNPEGMFVTVFAAILDAQTGILTYANAGHNKPILLGDKKDFLNVEPGIALGLFEDSGINEAKIELSKNQGIMLYTDGVTEAVNPKNEFYGEKRLIENMQKMKATNNSEEIANYVKNSVYEFYEDREQSDDLTLVTLLYF